MSKIKNNVFTRIAADLKDPIHRPRYTQAVVEGLIAGVTGGTLVVGGILLGAHLVTDQDD